MSEPAVVEPASTAQSAAPAFLGSASPGTTEPAATPPSHFLAADYHENGNLKEGWTEHFEKKGLTRLASDASKYKTEDDFWKAMDNKVGMVGKKTLGALPDESWHPNDVAKWRKDAGVPETAEGYELKPQKLPEGVEWDDAKASKYTEIFHKHNIPKAAAAELLALNLEETQGHFNHAREVVTTKIGELATTSEETFKKEWGPEYEARLESNRAYRATLISEEDMKDPIVQAMVSHPVVVRLLDESRRNLRGDLPGIGAEPTNGTKTPYQQASEIMAQPDYRSNRDKQAKAAQLMNLHAQQEQRKRR